MNPYVNHTLSELLDVILNNIFFKETTIKEVCEVAPTKIRSERDGVLLLRALRKTKYFEKANDILTHLGRKYPNSELLKSEGLWLIFSSKVCNGNNPDFKNDARQILAETTQTSQRTKLIYELTTLVTLSRLIRENDYKEAYKLTTHLNPFLLDEKGRQASDGRYFPSSRQQFYTDKARSLIGMDKVRPYINWVLDSLKFGQKRKEEFLDHIIKSCTYRKSDDTTIIYDAILSNYLYQLDLDMTSSYSNLPIKATEYNTILLSELSQFLFCPASYTLNKTFNIPAQKPIDSSSKWTGNRDGFFDRFNKYRNGEPLEKCFDYPSFENPHDRISIIKEQGYLEVFERLFNGNLIANNYFDNALKTFVSDDKKLTGAPDYIVKLRDGKRVVIAEKFSSSTSAGSEKVFNSDIVELEAFLTKFKHLKLDHAYFINWNWSVHRVQYDNGPDLKTMYISKVKVHKIELGQARESMIDQAIEKIEQLSNNKVINYASLGFANKCLNCNVYSYCEQKKGVVSSISVPYKT